MTNAEILFDTYEHARRDHGIVEAFRLVDAKAREIYQQPDNLAAEGLRRLHDRARTRACVAIRIFADRGTKVVVDLLNGDEREEATYDGNSVAEALLGVLNAVDPVILPATLKKVAAEAPEFADEIRAR